MTDHYIKSRSTRFYADDFAGGGGGDGFVGLDLDIVAVEVSLPVGVATAMAYDRVRKDTGGFSGSGGCVVTTEGAGDWEVDLFTMTQIPGATVESEAGIRLNGSDVKTSHERASGLGSGYRYHDHAIPAYTLYGLVAGDIITTWAASYSDNGFAQAGSYVRFRRLGPAS